MKITLESEDSTVTIENKVELERLSSFFGGLIIPMLQGAGYTRKSIDNQIADSDGCICDYVDDSYEVK